MLLPPVGPLPASSARDAAHVAPFVPVVEHASSGAAAIAISPVSLPVKRTVKGRSAWAAGAAAASATSSNAIAVALRSHEPDKHPSERKLESEPIRCRIAARRQLCAEA